MAWLIVPLYLLGASVVGGLAARRYVSRCMKPMCKHWKPDCKAVTRLDEHPAHYHCGHGPGGVFAGAFWPIAVFFLIGWQIATWERKPKRALLSPQELAALEAEVFKP